MPLLNTPLILARHGAAQLHPNLAAVYRAKVADLQRALAGGDASEALELARGLIEQITVHPADEARGVRIEVCGALAAMMRLTMGAGEAARCVSDRSLFARSLNVVGGLATADTDKPTSRSTKGPHQRLR